MLFALEYCRLTRSRMAGEYQWLLGCLWTQVMQFWKWLLLLLVLLLVLL